MNNVLLIGRLTRDPEFTIRSKSGKARATFTLAVNRRFSKEEEADFFRITVWEKLAENCATYLTKGSQCAIRGSIFINEYQDKETKERKWSTDITAYDVEFLGSSQVEEEDQPPLPQKPQRRYRK